MPKVLLSDTLADGWQDVFARESDIQVDIHTGLSEDELCDLIPGYEGLIVRSATQVTPKIIEAGSNLRVIGRAGVGVDILQSLGKDYKYHRPGGRGGRQHRPR